MDYVAEIDRFIVNLINAYNLYHLGKSLLPVLDVMMSHQMEILSALLALCAENSPVPGEFPSQGK